MPSRGSAEGGSPDLERGTTPTRRTRFVLNKLRNRYLRCAGQQAIDLIVAYSESHQRRVQHQRPAGRRAGHRMVDGPEWSSPHRAREGVFLEEVRDPSRSPTGAARDPAATSSPVNLTHFHLFGVLGGLRWLPKRPPDFFLSDGGVTWSTLGSASGLRPDEEGDERAEERGESAHAGTSGEARDPQDDISASDQRERWSPASCNLGEPSRPRTLARPHLATPIFGNWTKPIFAGNHVE
jgi:hypothetical protein